MVTVLALVALGLLGFIVYMEVSAWFTPATEPTTVPTTQPPTSETTTGPTEPPIPTTDLTAADFGYVDGVFTCITRVTTLALM